jgi:hypothetical protein
LGWKIQVHHNTVKDGSPPQKPKHFNNKSEYVDHQQQQRMPSFFARRCSNRTWFSVNSEYIV